MTNNLASASRVFLSSPPLPLDRIAGAMEYRQNNNALIALTKINTVGKAFDDALAHIAIQNGKLLRMGGDALQQGIDFGEGPQKWGQQ